MRLRTWDGKVEAYLIPYRNPPNSSPRIRALQARQITLLEPQIR